MDNYLPRPVLLIMIAILCVSCAMKDPEKRAAKFVGDPSHGLIVKRNIDSCGIVCQLIPINPQVEDTSVLHFRVYVSSPIGLTSDSALYLFNYHSQEYFRLVSGKDTLKSTLSERVATGRKDSHEFDVFFSRPVLSRNDSVTFLFARNFLFDSDVMFTYQVTNLFQATQALYNYETVR